MNERMFSIHLRFFCRVSVPVSFACALELLIDTVAYLRSLGRLGNIFFVPFKLPGHIVTIDVAIVTVGFPTWNII